MSTDDARAFADADDELVRRMALGDQGACAGLLERHLDRIRALAQRMLGNVDDANDVAQDTFLRAWQLAPDWQAGRARFSTWLYRVALNLCRDRLRARRPESAIDTVDLADAAPSPEGVAHHDQLVARLDVALHRLPLRQREALVLFHDHGLSQAEIAASLDISVEAVESLLARSRRALRRSLQEPLT
ncbi:MAG TPA: RNA polymerase sigma factor [Xanthomonadaceae bacterium]|nr:RNA polymerase sigma factor [Xanthomonadaceae bacterium]